MEKNVMQNTKTIVNSIKTQRKEYETPFVLVFVGCKIYTCRTRSTCGTQEPRRQPASRSWIRTLPFHRLPKEPERNRKMRSRTLPNAGPTTSTVSTKTSKIK